MSINEINGKRFDLDPWDIAFNQGHDAFFQALRFLPEDLKAKAVEAVQFALGSEMECTLSTFTQFCNEMQREFEESMTSEEEGRNYYAHHDPHAEQMADVPW